MRSLTVLFLLFCSSVSFADDCINVIALSKVISTTVEDKSSLDQHAENFCKEFSQSKIVPRVQITVQATKFFPLLWGPVAQALNRLQVNTVVLRILRNPGLMHISNISKRFPQCLCFV